MARGTVLWSLSAQFFTIDSGATQSAYSKKAEQAILYL